MRFKVSKYILHLMIEVYLQFLGPNFAVLSLEFTQKERVKKSTVKSKSLTWTVHESTCRLLYSDYFSSILTPSSFGGLLVTLLQCIKLFMVLMTLLVFLNSVLIRVLEVVS